MGFIFNLKSIIRSYIQHQVEHQIVYNFYFIGIYKIFLEKFIVSSFRCFMRFITILFCPANFNRITFISVEKFWKSICFVLNLEDCIVSYSSVVVLFSRTINSFQNISFDNVVLEYSQSRLLLSTFFYRTQLNRV